MIHEPFTALRAVLLLFFALFSCTLPLNNLYSIANSEGLPSAVVHGCVNTINGLFLENEVDLAIVGPEPIVLQRNWCQGEADLNNMCGWSFGQPQVVQIKQPLNGQKRLELSCRDAGGGILTYTTGLIDSIACLKERKSVSFSLKRDIKLSNCGWGPLSGRCNPKNSYAHFERKDNLCTIVSSDRVVRKFRAMGKRGKHDLSDSWGHLESEQRPNGSLVLYEYGKKGRTEDDLVKISATHLGNGTLYGSVHFETHYPRSNKVEYLANTSDGRKVKYVYTEFKPHDWRPNDPETGLRQTPAEEMLGVFNLTKVETLHHPSTGYKYEQKANSFCYQITEKRKPLNRFLKIDYYKAGINHLPGGGTIKLAADSPQVNRVKQLLAPVGSDGTPVATHRFLYYFNDSKGLLGGCTAVLDGQNHVTQYSYNARGNLVCLERFLGLHREPLTSYSRECFVWGTAPGSVPNILNGKFLQDSLGAIVWTRFFNYDSFGNVLVDQLRGNLTGEGIYPQVNTQGYPFEGIGDSYSRYYSYSGEPFHVLMSESEDNGKAIDYQYVPGTNWLSAKLYKTVEGYYKREFFGYDQWGVLSQRILDNGTGSSVEDLSGVSQRLVSYLNNREVAPALGVTAAETDSYLDPVTGTLVQLGAICNRSLSPQGEVLAQEFYDADNTLRYSINRAFDPHGNKILESNPIGETNIWQYDANDNLVMEQGPDKSCYVTHAYDFANRKISTSWIGADGERTNLMTYNLLSLCTSKRDYLNHLTRYHYNDVGLCACEEGPFLQDETGQWVNPVVYRDYDVLGNVIKYVDPLKGATTRSYTSRGQLAEEIFPDGTSEKKIYRPDGLLSLSIDRNQLYTRYVYDSQGRLKSKASYDTDDNCLGEESFVYDQTHLIAFTDAVGAVTEYTYDGAGRVSSERRGGVIKTSTYDNLNRLGCVKEQFGAGESDFILHAYGYDLLGRETESRVEDAHGNILRRNYYVYDALGNKISVIQDLGNGKSATTRSRYNSFNELVESEDAEGHKTNYERRFQRIDPYGQRILELVKTDPKGNQTIEAFNCLGKPFEITEHDPYGALLAKRECFYDLVGNLRRAIDSIYDGNGFVKCVVTEWEYNSMQQVTRLAEAVGTLEQKITRTLYNSRGQKSKVIKPDGSELEFEYDVKGRLQHQWSSDGTVDDIFAYDKCDRLLLVTDRARGLKTERSYDIWGHLHYERLANGLAFTYRNDPLGRPVEVILPDESRVQSIYGGMELVEVRRLDSEGNLRYVHRYTEIDRAGRVLKEVSSLTQNETTYSYDLLGRLIGIQGDHWSQEILKSGYDPVGNLNARHWKDAVGSIQAEYCYDALNQLLEERGGTHHTYSFDSLRNRLIKDGKRYLYNDLNQILQDGDSFYAYDANGGRVLKRNEKEESEYRYDALNRLIGLKNAQGETRYTYDGLNRRIKKEKFGVNGKLIQRERYLYHGEDEVGTVDGSGRIKNYRTLGRPHGTVLGRAVAIEIKSRVYIPVHDHNGNVVSLIDGEKGEAVEVYRYSAFGEELVYDAVGNKYKGSLLANPWRFASKRVDEESGLVFFGRRAYDPELGRWINPDPKGFEAGSNLYAYVGNSPLNRYDPYGLDWEGEASETGEEGLKPNFLLLEESCQTGRAYEDSKRWIERPFLEKIITATGELLMFIGEHLIPLPGVREIFAISGCILSGKNPNHYVPHWSREHSCWKLYQVGSPDSQNSDLGIFVNGMCNSYEASLESFMETMQDFNGFALHVYNAGHGFSADLSEVGLQKLGFPTNSVTVSTEGIRSFVSFLAKKGLERENIHLLGHSQGGLITYRTIQNLEPQIRSRLDVQTFGSAKIIFASSLGLHSAVNHVNSWDPIPSLADPLGFIVGRCQGCVNMLHSEEGLFAAHAYRSKAYKKARKGE